MNTDGVIRQFSFVLPLKEAARAYLQILAVNFDMPVSLEKNVFKFAEFISVWYGNSSMLRQPSKVASVFE